MLCIYYICLLYHTYIYIFNIRNFRWDKGSKMNEIEDIEDPQGTIAK